MRYFLKKVEYFVIKNTGLGHFLPLPVKKIHFFHKFL